MAQNRAGSDLERKKQQGYVTEIENSDTPNKCPTFWSDILEYVSEVPVVDCELPKWIFYVKFGQLRG